MREQGDPWIGDPGQPLLPLWRGLLVYRALTLASSVVAALLALRSDARPWLSIAMLAVMVAWTAVIAVAYQRPGRRPFVYADLAVTIGVMATTPLVQTPAQLAADAPIMGSIWTPGPAFALALEFGVRGGAVGSAVIAATLLLISDRVSTELNDIQLIVLVALALGFASTVVRRSALRMRRAIAAEAALRERERLARAVHDGVLQVLGFVRRRGREAGGTAGELGELAGEQEIALRTLLTSGPAAVDADGRRDVGAALRRLTSPRVTVAAPAGTVDVPARIADEIVAAVGEALANVERHVGADAPAWVLLEDTDGMIEISVRDEGPGIAPGRLAQAEADGRMGVARSLCGRVRDLGGTIACETGPGGTEWIIKVPRP